MDASWLEAVLMRHERENSIYKITNVRSESAVPKGENYTSAISRATLDVILGSGRRTTKKAIIKEEIKGKTQQALEEFSVFKVEIKNYVGVLQKMANLMDERGDKNETLWCQLYGYRPNDTIVFQDLAEEGYVLANRKECLDIDHASLVLRGLGRFHAMSKILLTNGVISPDDARPFYPSDADKPLIQKIFSGALKQLSNVIIQRWPSEWKDMGARLEKESEFICPKLKTIVDKVESDKFEVFNHGDLWTSNMLFKYSDNKPIGVKFLDYQGSHFNSYIFDFVYFLNTSVKPEIRRRRMDELADIYLNSLQSTLKFYNYEGFIPGKEHFIKELARTDYYAFAVLCAMHPITTADSTKAFDIEKLGEKDGANDALNEDVLASPRLINSIGLDLKNFAKKGII